MPLTLRAYLAATHLVPLRAKAHLQKRIARGKEHPDRWTEKLGNPTQDRPKGTLIWLHAVGLGEVLSLRGLIAAMAKQSDAHFLVTSSTRAGAEVLGKNAPPRTVHQFLPLDAPAYRRRFLDHWQPDLCIWAEQDLWPGFVTDLAKRGTPQALIAARMTAQSYRKKSRVRATFAYLYNQMAMRTANDERTSGYMQSLGTPPVPVTGSLKPAAPPLTCDPAELEGLQAALKGRFVWMTAPSHAADEARALAAHKRLRAGRPDALLIIAPRFLDRTIDCDLPMAVRSKGQTPAAQHAVYLADTFGDLGLLYRLADAALVGGTNDATEGHSPWEAATLHTAIFHGPQTANFENDYKSLHAAHAALCVTDADALAKALQQDLAPQITNATAVIAAQQSTVNDLAQDLLALT